MSNNNIAIVGLGYVGLPLAIEFLQKNFKVYGFENDKAKISKLKSHKSYINHISNKKFKSFIVNNKFILKSSFEDIKKCKLIIFCLPTPLDISGKKPDLSILENASKKVFPFLKKNQILSLESSTFPGTTEKIFYKKLKKKFKIGKNFFLVYSPEREDPGSSHTISKIPKLISGFSKKCLANGSEYYSKVFKKLIKVDEIKIAETAKLYENIFRSVNIGLANEMKLICQKLDMDIYKVISAASTKPFGFLPFYPGPGVGGHCIPIDPIYLSWHLKNFGFRAKFIDLALKINNQMCDWIIDTINFHLKGLKNKKILILGISYKKNIDDARESPSLKIIKKLLKEKCKVYFNDPYFTTLPTTRNLKIDLKRTNLSSENISNADAVLLLTDHDKFNYKRIYKFSNKIFDTRGRYDVNQKKIVRI